VEEQLPSLISKMLAAKIERHPPKFPWENEEESIEDETEEDRSTDDQDRSIQDDRRF
jgi:hypothetical protein